VDQKVPSYGFEIINFSITTAHIMVQTKNLSTLKTEETVIEKGVTSPSATSKWAWLMSGCCWRLWNKYESFHGAARLTGGHKAIRMPSPNHTSFCFLFGRNNYPVSSKMIRRWRWLRAQSNAIKSKAKWDQIARSTPQMAVYARLLLLRGESIVSASARAM
jgi:hypothetical protein